MPKHLFFQPPPSHEQIPHVFPSDSLLGIGRHLTLASRFGCIWVNVTANSAISDRALKSRLNLTCFPSLDPPPQDAIVTGFYKGIPLLKMSQSWW